jgi:hypothetical protein
VIASSICGSTAGINLIWYSADLTLSRIAYVLEPDLNGRSYGAVYVTDDFGAGDRHGMECAALLPQWRRQHRPADAKRQSAFHLRLRRRHVDQGLHFLT